MTIDITSRKNWIAALRRSLASTTGSILIAGLLVAALACGDSTRSVEDAARVIRSGDREGGLEILRALLAEDPENPELLFVYGRALANGGQISAARWPLTKAMKNPEWQIPAGMLAAQGAYATHGYEDAISITSQILETYPEHIPALLLRAEAGLDARLGYEAPLEDTERVLDLDPQNEHALRLKIVSLLNLERVDEATESLEALSAILTSQGETDESARADLCAIEGTFLFEKGDLDAARIHWNSCLDEFPANTRILEPAVEFFETLGENERAIQVLEVAAGSSPGNGAILEALTTRLSAASRSDEAESLLREATEETPAIGWGLLADHYLGSGDHQGRAEALDHLIEALPGLTTADLAFARADAWLLAGDLEKAEVLAQQLDVPAQKALLLGRIALERGDAAKALDLFEETTRLWPNQTFARYYAGYAGELLGDFDRAIEEYRHAIRSGAEETDARYRLAQIYFAEGKDLTALETLSLSHGEDSMNARKLLFHILGRNRRIEAIRQQMASYWSIPGIRADLFEQAVIGFSEIGGPAAAAKTVESIPIDLLDPRDATLLRRYVTLQLRAGNAEAAAERTQRTLATAPGSAHFNEIAGLILEHSGQDPEKARPYYERAIELDPNHTRALLGLARLDMAAERPAVGKATLDRAIATAGSDRALLIACATVLLQLDEDDRAESILTELARDEPSDSYATAALARLRFERGMKDDWTLVLAESAVRLGGGMPAMRLLASIHEARGETEAADAIRRRIQHAEARAGRAPSPEEESEKRDDSVKATSQRDLPD